MAQLCKCTPKLTGLDTLTGWIGASLVAQWWTICLPMQETRIWSVVQEDSTCLEATTPMSHNYWGCALEPGQVFLVAQMVKNLSAMQETQVLSLGWEDPLEKGMFTHSSILAWRIPWTEEPGRIQSMGPQSQTRLKRLSTHACKTIRERERGVKSMWTWKNSK